MNVSFYDRDSHTIRERFLLVGYGINDFFVFFLKCTSIVLQDVNIKLVVRYVNTNITLKMGKLKIIGGVTLLCVVFRELRFQATLFENPAETPTEFFKTETEELSKLHLDQDSLIMERFTMRNGSGCTFFHGPILLIL